MMREYIRRFHHPDISAISICDGNPVERDLWRDGLSGGCAQGLPSFAGLDLSDADVLRRAMSGKYRSRVEFQKIVDKFFQNCRERGYPEDVTREVWRQIESFAGYSFSKAHSASYAVESFQSLYLKAHYPLEFMVAVINNFGASTLPGVPE
jgi:DNA polymerase-3 subunit alpha